MARTYSHDSTSNGHHGHGHTDADAEALDGEPAAPSSEPLLAGMQPAELIESALDFLRGNGRGVALTAVYLARRYPVPMMVAGLGYLAWKMASRRPDDIESRVDSLRTRVRSGANSARRHVHERMSDVRDRVGDVRDRVGEVRDRVSSAGERAAERAAEVRDFARERATRTRETVSRTVSDHPVAVGAAVLAVAAVAGTLLFRGRDSGIDYEGEDASDMPDDDAYELEVGTASPDKPL